MKRPILTAAVLLLLASLTACKPAAPKRTLPAAAVPDSPEVVTLRLQTWGSSQTDGGTLDAVIAAFQQQYPQYRVEKVNLWPNGGGGNEQLGTAMKQGKVDIAQAPYQDEFVAKGSTALESYIHRDGLNVKPYGSLMEQGLVGGHNYGLPFYLMPRAVSANGEVLKAAGIALPEPNWTWEQFRTLAQKVANPLGEKPVWAVADPAIEEWVRLYLEGQADRPAWQATDSELKDALAYFRALISLDRSVQPPTVRTWEYYPTMAGDDTAQRATAAFGAGSSAFLLGGYVSGTGGTRWPALPTPVHPGRPTVMSTWVQWLSVASGSANPDAAWAFVKFAAGPEGARLVAKSGNLPGYLDEQVETAWFGAEPKPVAATQAYFNAKWLVDDLSGPRSTSDQRNLARIYRLANRVLTGTMDVETALAEFHKEMDGRVLGK